MKIKPKIYTMLLMGFSGTLLSLEALSFDGALNGKAPQVNQRGGHDTYDARSMQAKSNTSPLARGGKQSESLKAIKETLSKDAAVSVRGHHIRLSDPNSTLTSASSDDSPTVVRKYLKGNLSSFKIKSTDVDNLTVARVTQNVDGGTQVIMVPTVGGIPFFDNEVRANLSADQELVTLSTNLPPNLRDNISAADLQPRLSAREAVAAAYDNARIIALVPNVVSTTGVRKVTQFDNATTMAKLVLFDTNTAARLAWRLVVMDPDTDNMFQYVVDAKSGKVLYRQSLTNEATGLAWDFRPGADVGGTQQPKDLTPYLTFTDRLQGNNAHVWASTGTGSSPRPQDEVPPSNGQDYLYPFTPVYGSITGCSAYSNQDYCSWDPAEPFSWGPNLYQNATQVFYLVNKFHDYLASDPIGFTESRGNFQAVNAGGSSGAGDPVKVRATHSANWDGNGFPYFLNNANMGTPPDGMSPVMTMYLTTNSRGGGAINTGDDAAIVFHEYTHGLTNRRVVDADGFSLLGGFQAKAMGEAWSDFYALDFLESTGYLTDHPLIHGELQLSPEWMPYGIRVMPIDCPIGSTAFLCGPAQQFAGGITGGLTYGNMGHIVGTVASPAYSFHNDGQIWAQTLWDLRTALIDQYGKTEGLKRVRTLVTRALELAPANRIDFLNMRDAILLADQLYFPVGGKGRHDKHDKHEGKNKKGGEDSQLIWQIFANRGMGYFAMADNFSVVDGELISDGSLMNPVEDFSLPSEDKGVLKGIVKDSSTNRPVTGVYVAFEGPSFASQLSDLTDKKGEFKIKKVPEGKYPILYAMGAGYEPGGVANVKVRDRNTRPVEIKITRDWSALSGGAVIHSFGGQDFSDYGCGPNGAIDQSSTVWGSNSPTNPDDPGPKFIVIKLPQAVNIDRFSINPTSGCGDSVDASLGQYTIETSQDGINYVLAASGAFTDDDNYHFNDIRATTGVSAVLYVRLNMLGPQDPEGPSGIDYVDMTEIKVFGDPS